MLWYVDDFFWKRAIEERRSSAAPRSEEGPGVSARVLPVQLLQGREGATKMMDGVANQRRLRRPP